jgi:hypothetical protein
MAKPAAARDTLRCADRAQHDASVLDLAFVVAETSHRARIGPARTRLFLRGLIGSVAALLVMTKSWW